MIIKFSQGSAPHHPSLFLDRRKRERMTVTVKWCSGYIASKETERYDQKTTNEFLVGTSFTFFFSFFLDSIVTYSPLQKANRSLLLILSCNEISSTCFLYVWNQHKTLIASSIKTFLDAIFAGRRCMTSRSRL